MEETTNFIHDIIDDDLATGRETNVHTRFPPEPNGYLHIGSVKAIWINWLTAKKYGGLFNLRYDDTNPTKEEVEFVEAIEEDLRWLGAIPDGGIFYGSDYFDKCYEYAIKLIKDGNAFVCDLSKEDMVKYRGTLSEPGINSPFRDRSVEENLDLFVRMKNGEFPDGARTLRAKIDMSSPNITLRDPAIYRIVHASHHRQGNKWCIYPLYDFAHPIQDALEGITHSLCSIEFENNRPLYNWVVDKIGFEKKPHQWEFGKMKITYTVMGKRYLRHLVEEKKVDGWDDPRMPTIRALRRRGYTPSAIFEFIKRAGVSKALSTVDIQLLEHCIREELNMTALRKFAVLNPLKVTVINFPENETEFFDISNNPNDENSGKRKVPFTKHIYIERDDFAEIPPPKFHRLKPGGEVRLAGAYIIKCEEVIKDENGNVTEVLCSCDRETSCNSPADGRKIKGTVHWVSAENAVEATVNLYDRLFTDSNVPLDWSCMDYFNENSLTVIPNAKLEPSLAEACKGERFQFTRIGYFVKDTKYENAYNLIVNLKDSYKT